MTAANFDPRIRAYYGDDMLRAGFMPLPHLFLRHYRKLGLSHIQALLVLQLIEITWDLSDAPSTVARLSERLGVDRRTVQICLKDLQDLGLIEVFDQWDQKGAQAENGYDLSPMFERIAAMEQPNASLRILVRKSRETTPRGHPDQRRPEGTRTNDAEEAAAAFVRHSAPERGILPDFQEIPRLEPRNDESTTNRNDGAEETPQGMRRTDRGGRRGDRWGGGAGIASPAACGSPLKKKNKKPEESTQEKKNYHHQGASTPQPAPMAQAALSGGGVTQTNQSPFGSTNGKGTNDKQRIPPMGRSLRLGTELREEQMTACRTLLEQVGVRGNVAAAAAPTLTPAEAWTLRLYMRAGRLSPAWIAAQVYDFKRQRPRAADVPAHYDEAGHAFAQLDARTAEMLCDRIDAACPAQYATIEASVRRDLHDDPAVMLALRLGWALMAEQRGGVTRLPGSPAAPTLPTEQPDGSSAAPTLWEDVLQRLRREVPPDQFATWLAPAVLLEHNHDLAVVGTPNVFARDELATTHRDVVERALAAVLGHTVAVEVVIV